MSKRFPYWPSSTALRKSTAVLGVALTLSVSVTAQNSDDDSLGSQSQTMQMLKQHFQRDTQRDAMPADIFNDSGDDSGAAMETSGFNLRTKDIPMPRLQREKSEKFTERADDFTAKRVVDPPTEFQTFVKNSSGMDLPIYGSSLFDQVPSTFAPVDRVPVSPDYTIGPGDELEVRLWGQINSNQRLVVDRTGDVFFPQVGRISVSGLRFIDLEPAMKNSVGRVFRNFDMSVNMGQLRSIQVFIMGRARRPGTYTVSSLSTMVNALFVSGGPSSQGSMRAIQLKRGGRVVTTFDLYDLLLRGDKTKDVALQPGDVIYIPPAGPRVAVGGSVETGAVYEIAPNTNLRQVLGYAGGLSPVAAGQHAILERIDGRANLASENIELNEQGLDTSLQDGDLIKLLQVVPRFNKTVALKGNVADAVRLPWHEGMKVSDVIPDKQALLTRNYWTEHNSLTSGSAAHVDTQSDTKADGSVAAVVSYHKAAATREFDTKNDLQPPAPDINWSYAAIERLDAQNLTTHLVPFNLGKAVLEHDAAADLTLQPGDVITVFSNADFITPTAMQTRYVRLEGEIRMAGVYSVQPGESLRQLIQRAGGFTDKAYLYGAEFTRESTRRDQKKRMSEYLDQVERELDQSSTNLAARTMNSTQEASARVSMESQRKALERLRDMPATGRIVLDLPATSNDVTSVPDVLLENGDRFVVPSAPATVGVLGTVYNQSTFLYKPDSTVREYLEQSGGATRLADQGHMFVLRADGSVYSKATNGHFLSEHMHPGDTLVVPTNVTKISRVRTFLDWSQVISGFGVGAAAVNVLR
jgi:polysaccharide biosynthesis/export protein